MVRAMSVSLETFMGGGRAYTPMTGDVTLTRASPRMITVDPNAAGRKIVLPDATLLKLGSPRFIILNINGTNTVEIEDADGGTVLSALGTSQGAVVALSENATSAGRWLTRVSSL